MVYNEVEGDGDLVLDRQIKAAYGSKFTIVDARKSDGYAEPSPTEGSMPGPVRDQNNSLIGGYVLMAYIVSADGLVADPVVLKSSDRRLEQAALEAMKGWRFTPASLKGSAVSTTAAQEFSFGPLDLSRGFSYDRLITYQNSDLLRRRIPGAEELAAYLAELRQVVHNFFLGASRPERLHVVFILQPGGHSRFWFVSSTREGDAADLEPLRRLLEGVNPATVGEGPVALALSGRVAGGDGKAADQDRDGVRPLPKEWREAAGTPGPAPSVFSDDYLNLVWRDAK